MEVSFEVHAAHIPLWERQDWRYAFLMGGRGNGRSGSASRYVVSRLLGEEYTRGAIMREVREDTCKNCPHAGSMHNWKVQRIRGRCEYTDCGCIGYVPDTDQPKPVNSVIGRSTYGRR